MLFAVKLLKLESVPCKYDKKLIVRYSIKNYDSLLKKE